MIKNCHRCVLYCFTVFYLEIRQPFCRCSKHPIGADQIENFESLPETKGLIPTDVGPKMMPPKSFIGYFPKRDPQNADTQAEWYEKCTFLFCWTFEEF